MDGLINEKKTTQLVPQFYENASKLLRFVHYTVCALLPVLFLLALAENEQQQPFYGTKDRNELKMLGMLLYSLLSWRVSNKFGIRNSALLGLFFWSGLLLVRFALCNTGVRCMDPALSLLTVLLKQTTLISLGRLALWNVPHLHFLVWFYGLSHRPQLSWGNKYLLDASGQSLLLPWFCGVFWFDLLFWLKPEWIQPVKEGHF